MDNRDRLARLVVERVAGLTLYARQWLDAAAAEDVVQEALVRLLTQRVAPDDPVRWMFRAVRNAAIDQARSATRRRRREESLAQTRPEWFDAHCDSILDGKSAEQALRSLPIDAREIVVLRIWGELGFAQIAQMMSMSISTVHERYTSALARLAAHWRSHAGTRRTE